MDTPRTTHHAQRPRGQIILFVLFMIVTLSASALLYNRFFSTETKSIITFRNSTQALLSADLGLERLMFYLFDKNVGTARCGSSVSSSFDGCMSPYSCTQSSPCTVAPDGLQYYYSTSTGGIVISSGSFAGTVRTFFCIDCQR